MTQFTLNLDPAVHERFGTLREFIAFRAQACVSKPMKVQAADMDMAPSTLSRKLTPSDGDTQRLNVDDLEAWIASTGDAAAVVECLASKYLDNDATRRQRVAAKLEAMVPELLATLAQLKGERA